MNHRCSLCIFVVVVFVVLVVLVVVVGGGGGCVSFFDCLFLCCCCCGGGGGGGGGGGCGCCFDFSKMFITLFLLSPFCIGRPDTVDLNVAFNPLPRKWH